jgi:hypothetical protein
MVTLFNVPVKRMFVVALVVLMGCKDSDKNSSLIFEEINWSLENSNIRLMLATEVTIENLKSKAQSPASAEKAQLLLSNARFMQAIAGRVVSFIDSLKAELIKNRSGNEEDKTIINATIIEKGKAGDLYSMLLKSKTEFLNVDSSYSRELGLRIITVANESFVRMYQSAKSFEKAFFKNKAFEEVIVNLSKFKNDILVTENALIDFLNYQITSRVVIVDYFPKALTSQNATHFKNGEELSITTGIGAYGVVQKQKISINSLNVEVKNGIAVYTMKVNNKPGIYKVPISIKFIGPEGKEEVHSDNIEYTVVD